MTKKKFINIAKLIFKLALSAILVYFVFQKIDYRHVRSVFLRSNLLYIFFALLSYAFSQVVSSWRLIGFLRSIGIELTFSFNSRLYLLGMFYNTFLPGGIGGDGYKIYLLRKKYRQPAKKIFLALFFDRLSGLWAICALASLLVFLLPGTHAWNWLPATIFIAGTVVYYLIMRFFFTTYSGYWAVAHSKAIIVQFLQLVSVVCILRAQDFTGNFFPYLFIFLLSTVATIIPVSIGGLGIREFVMLKSIPFLLIDGTLAVYTTLTFYLLSLVISLPGVWFVYHSKEFRPAVKEPPG
ncbi:MAG: lysylphosphatidylglycerol synthase transmembrane domain-containing protein [Bacteroidota bacterium]